jgi:hypothetical protein
MDRYLDHQTVENVLVLKGDGSLGAFACVVIKFINKHFDLIEKFRFTTM